MKIWRQAGPGAAGRLEDYTADDVSPDMSFLEMLDVVNEGLVRQGKDAIAFDSDCREGICGMCSLVVNGVAFALAAAVVPGFDLAGFGSAVLGALLVSIVSWILGAVFKPGR